jgi:ADP-ribose pyrophosphatase
LSHSKLLYKGFVSLTEKIISKPSGNYPYITVHTKPQAVIIIPKKSDDSFMLVHEYRYAVEKRILSFPAGLVDGSETPLISAKRELLEETGYEADTWEALGTIYPLPGLLEQVLHIFLATDIICKKEPKLDPIEDITVEFFSKERLTERIAQGGGVDGPSLGAYALYSSMKR